MKNKDSGTHEKQDSIDAVRDLLFGQRAAELNGQIDQSEKQLRDSIGHLEERLSDKFRDLENLISDQVSSSNGRFESVDQRINSETDARIGQGEDIRRALDQIEKSLNEKFTKLEDRFHRFETKTTKEMHDRFRKVSDEQSNSQRVLLEKIEKGLEQVSKKSTDRTELGDFLIDLGLKLQPGKKPAKNRTPKGEAELSS